MRRGFAKPSGAKLEHFYDGVTVTGDGTTSAGIKLVNNNNIHKTISMVVPLDGDSYLGDGDKANIVRWNNSGGSAYVAERVMWRNEITYSTTDLTPGTSPLAEGKVYLVYE